MRLLVSLRVQQRLRLRWSSKQLTVVCSPKRHLKVCRHRYEGCSITELRRDLHTITSRLDFTILAEEWSLSLNTSVTELVSSESLYQDCYLCTTRPRVLLCYKPNPSLKSNNISMKTAETELQYWLAPEDGGTDEIWPGLVKALRIPRVMVKTKVTDVRRSESDFSLDKQGFAWVHAPTVQKTWDDDDEIKRVYYPECEELLKRVTGASHAFCFNHVQRGEDWSKIMEDIENFRDDDIEFRSANNCYIHCDYSYRGAEQFYERLVVNGPKEDLKSLAQHPRRRWALINLWRPRQTINRDALCVADAHSITDDELAEQTIRWLKAEQLSEAQKEHPQFPKYQAGAPDTFLWAVKPPADPVNHRWYYASQMTPDEALLFKMYDSRKDEGIPRRVPHTSFRSEADNGPPRESVELRAFVIWQDQDGDS